MQVRLALRFVQRCRRIEPHPPQDRPNFGTDRVTYPDRVEVTRENAHRQQGRPQSVVMLVRPLPTIAAAEYWNPSFGTHFDFGFAPPASDSAGSALRLSHGTFRHGIPSVTIRHQQARCQAGRYVANRPFRDPRSPRARARARRSMARLNAVTVGKSGGSRHSRASHTSLLLNRLVVGGFFGKDTRSFPIEGYTQLEQIAPRQSHRHHGRRIGPQT